MLTNNTIVNTRHSGVFVSTVGVNIVGGSFNRILENHLENNSAGLSLSYSQNNVIAENNIINNHGWMLEFTWGISFFEASNNTVYGNNFINNTAQVGSKDSMNLWDNGTIGNYWSDYNGNGSYIIDSNNFDQHPLAQPVNVSPNFPELTFLIILPLFAVMPLIATVILRKKRI